MSISSSVPLTSSRDGSASTQRILVVEDEPAISGFVRRGLLFEGYEVEVAATGRTALEVIRDRPPDLVVLDLMLPEVDGIEVTRRVRAAEDADHRLPILMLTARDAVTERVAGLEIGADDYLVKPFDFDELLARVRALLRRAHVSPAASAASEMLRFGDIVLQSGSRTVTRDGDQVELTAREFDLLTLFMRNPNRVLDRATLMDRVWGDDFFGESNVLEVVIGNLRRALEGNDRARVIQTVRGVGYVLRQP